MITLNDQVLPYPNVFEPQLSANRPMHLMLSGTWRRHGSGAGYTVYLRWDFLTIDEKNDILDIVDAQNSSFDGVPFFFEDAIMGEDLEIDEVFINLGESTLGETGKWSLDLTLIQL